MKVVIFGATGPVGRAIVTQALEAGHEVTLLTRNPEKAAFAAGRAAIVRGEVSDPQCVAEVLRGQEAVIQSIGIGGKGDGSPTRIVSDANRIIVEAMKRTAVRRYIAISIIGAGDSYRFLPWVFRRIALPCFMRWFRAVIDDKNRMEADIVSSGLDWTIVRSTALRERPGTGARATLDGRRLTFSVSDEDLGAFAVGQLNDPTYLHRAPTVFSAP